MELIVGTERTRVSDQDLLGEGGEARVFGWKDLALKIFHPPGADPVARRGWEQKLLKLNGFPAGLPPLVVGPQRLVRDRRGEVVGYAMARVKGAVEAGLLANRRWRETSASHEQVGGFFRALAQGLGALHTAKVVVGDLNDANVLARGEEPFLIDADSMQVLGLPCPVGHERFLDPRLYGVDLAAAPAFDAGSDWYAFAVMLFSSLLYVHPFGGVHPSLRTPMRRAEARHSLYRPDVAWPRTAVHHRVLPDEVNEWFVSVFEKGERGPAPEAALRLGWSRCGCGTVHARRVCPQCQALGQVRLEAVRHKGRCLSRTVFHTHGQVLAAALRGGLRYAYLEEGVLRREGGEALGVPWVAGMRVVPAGHATWVVPPDGQVLKVEGGRVTERSSTSTGPFGPVFAASASAAWHEEGGWLVDLHTGARVGQVLEGQTRLWAGERLGLGFYRAGGFTSGFLLRPGRAGLVPVELPAIEGRLVEAQCAFDDAHALLSLTTERAGREIGWMYLFDGTGKRVAQASGPASERMFQAPRSRAVMAGRVVCASDDGLLALSVEQGRLLEGRLFVDSQGFAGAGDELIVQPDGSLYVVGSGDITQLTLQ